MIVCTRPVAGLVLVGAAQSSVSRQSATPSSQQRLHDTARLHTAAAQLRHGSLWPARRACQPARRRGVLKLQAQGPQSSLPGLDLYALVAVSLAFQLLASISEPHFSWLHPPKVHPHTAAIFLQLTFTAAVSWYSANLCVGGFKPGVASDLKETFQRTLLAFLIALPLTSAQLEISHWASGFTAVSACNSRRVAGILGAMSLWRIGIAVYAESWDLAYYDLVEGPRGQQRALASIACAVGIFIVSWHTLTSALHSGALDGFAASLVSSPGSLLE